MSPGMNVASVFNFVDLEMAGYDYRQKKKSGCYV